MSLFLHPIGTALPDTVMTQEEGLELARVFCSRTAEQETWLPSMYSHTGIRQRHLAHPRALIRDVIDKTKTSGSIFLPTGAPDDCGPTTAQRMALYAEWAPPLAVKASRAALHQSDLAPAAIRHLVTVSCTGFVAPGVERHLITGLDLAPTVQRTHVGYMGCHGAINGLRVANGLSADGPVLLCAVEVCSLHYHYGWDPQRIIANALFADGSAALICMRQQEAPGWHLRATGSCLIPDSATAMAWTIGEHGFEMTLSRKVPSLIATHLRPWLTRWLADRGLSQGDVASWAIHPGGPRILEAVEESLGLRAEQTADSRAVFAECGNMSSPTILFIVDRLRRRGAPLPCVALGFGPGLTAEAALFANPS